MPTTLAQEIKKRLPFESLAQEAYLNLIRTHAILTAPAERFFKHHGISSPKYNILRILRGSKTNGEAGKFGLPSLEIADRLITRVPDITRLVDGLEVDRLIVRTRCTQDRRVVYVGITAKGLALLEKLDQPLCDLHRITLAHMTATELEQLNVLLVKARHAEMTTDK